MAFIRNASPPLRTGLWAGVAMVMLTLAGCGPGGGNQNAIPTQMSGVVRIPAGSPSLGKISGKISSFARFRQWLAPEALALTGMAAVGAGVVVSLYVIDDNGERLGGLLGQTQTDDTGTYTLQIPSWDAYNPNLPRVLAVGNAIDGTRMRRLVDDLDAVATARDIDPATEAATRILVDDVSGRPFRNVSPAEMAELTAQVVEAADAVTGLTIADTARVATRVASGDESVQRKLVSITATATSTRPLALAGRDQQLLTATEFRKSGNAEDPDEDIIDSGFQWTFDLAPAGSSVSVLPPAGPEVVFTPDLDGTYRLQLVITDANGAVGPPDFVTFVATRGAALLTDNTAIDSQAQVGRARNWLVYTSSTRSLVTAENISNVHLQDINDAGPIGCPWRLQPPASRIGVPNGTTTNLHPAISTDETMMVYVTDADPAQPDTGKSDLEIVALPIRNILLCAPPNAPVTNDPQELIPNSFWVTNNLTVDTQPDVECRTEAGGTLRCVIVYLSETATTDVLRFFVYINNGQGFQYALDGTIDDGLTGHVGAHLSTDGRVVTYSARVDSGSDLDVYIASIDNPSDPPVRLTHHTANDDQAAADFTASRVVYRRSGEIYLDDRSGLPALNLTGPLTAVGGRSSDPAISGDGQTVAFVGDVGSGPNLYVYAVATGRLTQLTTTGTASQPRLSDDGLKVLFRSDDLGDTDIFLRDTATP